MIKIVIFDVDGVIINREKYFSEKLAERLNLNLKEEVLPFFTGPFQECLMGRKDLKVEIVPWLVKWGWVGTVDTFLDYWFEEEKVIEVVAGLTSGLYCSQAEYSPHWGAKPILTF